MSNTMKIEAPGYQGRLIGIWRGRTDGPAAAAHKVANDARMQATGFALAVSRIANDGNLTTQGKAEPLRNNAMERLTPLRDLAKQAAAAQDGIAKQRAAMLKVAPPDAATAVYDVAIGQYLRGLDDRDAAKFRSSIATGEASPRMIDAVARMPAELVGMSAQQHREVLDTAAARRDPEGWEALSEAALAWEDAADIIHNATEFVAHGAPVQAGTVQPAVRTPDLPYRLPTEGSAWQDDLNHDLAAAA